MPRDFRALATATSSSRTVASFFAAETATDYLPSQGAERFVQAVSELRKLSHRLEDLVEQSKV